jgi:peptide/nickel transport system permease protein
VTRFLAIRLLRAMLTLFGISTLSFFLLRMNGDPALLMLPDTATPQDVLALDKALGFDRPLLAQYGLFLLHLIHGDLGNSLRQGVPAISLVLQRLPATVELALLSFGVGTGLALLLAIVVQVGDRTALRTILLWVGVARQAIPNFVFAVFLILIFAVALRWLPSMGRDNWRSLVLPVTTIASYEVTLYLRLIDSAFGEQGQLDYVRTAFAKGASRTRVILRHIAPNALLPVLTVAGLNLGYLLSGLAIIEKVYNWPGMGRLVIDAVVARDFPVVQAGLIVVSALFVLVNLLVDLLYVALDPRMRL